MALLALKRAQDSQRDTGKNEEEEDEEDDDMDDGDLDDTDLDETETHGTPDLERGSVVSAPSGGFRITISPLNFGDFSPFAFSARNLTSPCWSRRGTTDRERADGRRATGSGMWGRRDSEVPGE